MAEAAMESGQPVGRQPATPTASPLAYRTFSKNLAPAFTAAGGLATAAGGLGTWIRIARADREGDPLKDVGALMGYSEPLGWVLAILGVLTAVGAIAWLSSSFVTKLIPITGAVIVTVMSAQRLPYLTGEAQRAAVRATEQLGFAGFHAGWGWGAWLLLSGSVLLLLGALAGILREMDLRRGFGE